MRLFYIAKRIQTWITVILRISKVQAANLINIVDYFASETRNSELSEVFGSVDGFISIPAYQVANGDFVPNSVPQIHS